METVKFKTTGMHCNSCSMLVQMSVEDLPGVDAVTCSLATGITEVTYEPEVLDRDKIAATIVDAGYGAELVG